MENEHQPPDGVPDGATVPRSYRAAGVDIDRGDRFTHFIQNIKSSAVARTIGGFAGGVPLDLRGFREPMLFSTTDGVGTKILVAKALGDYSTIGIDLVAMCVNDLAVCGVQPQVFLDYIACGRIEERMLHAVMDGIVAGCEQAACVLAGGETAEMPDLYGEDDIDLAGFCVGIADRSQVLPRTTAIARGDRVFGLAASGIHSNGLSLARKVVPHSDTQLWRGLLTPTRIYVRELMALIDAGIMTAAAHITGGGMVGNVQRVIPADLRLRLDDSRPIPELFAAIQRYGSIPEEEMFRVFNMGVGIALIVPADQATAFTRHAAAVGVDLLSVGELVAVDEA